MIFFMTELVLACLPVIVLMIICRMVDSGKKIKLYCKSCEAVPRHPFLTSCVKCGGQILKRRADE